MGNCFLHGNGGLPLNFKVVGGASAPTSPRENTIWVNTSNDITGWTFDAKEPNNPSEGLVWFKVGTMSNIVLNALKKNSVQIYLINASQYVGGKFASLECQVYQGSEWKALTVEPISLVGKFVIGTDTSVVPSLSGNTYSFNTVYGISEGCVASPEMVDVTRYNKIRVVGVLKLSKSLFDTYAGRFVKVSCGLANTASSGSNGSNYEKSESQTLNHVILEEQPFDITVDVSEIEGMFYILTSTCTHSSVLAAGVSTTITSWEVTE